MSEIKYLKPFINGEYVASKCEKYTDAYNPSTGEVIAKVPCCTVDEVNLAVESAKEAFKTWSRVPIMKRVQVLYKVRELIEKNMDELTYLVAL